MAERDTELIDGHNKLALRRGRANRLKIVEIEDSKFSGFLKVLEGKVGICSATLNSKLCKNEKPEIDTLVKLWDCLFNRSLIHAASWFVTLIIARLQQKGKRGVLTQPCLNEIPYKNIPKGESCSAASLKYFADSSSLPSSWNLIAFATFASASLVGANSSFSLREGFFCDGVECELPDGFGGGASGTLFVAGDCGFEVGGE